LAIGQFILQKAVLAVSYDPTGKFVDRRGKLLDQLDTPWAYRQYFNDKLVLRQKDLNAEGEVTWKSARFDIERLGDFDRCRDLLRKLVPPIIWDTLGVSRLRIAALRVMLLHPHDDFEDLVAKLLRLYSIPQSVWSPLGGSPADLACHFEFNSEPFRVTLWFSPALPRHLEPALRSTEGLPDCALNLDCQLAATDLPAAKLHSSISDATNLIEGSICDVVRSLSLEVESSHAHTA